jgi:hypothetical protein
MAGTGVVVLLDASGAFQTPGALSVSGSTGIARIEGSTLRLGTVRGISCKFKMLTIEICNEDKLKID